jgi:hypothetical protein
MAQGTRTSADSKATEDTLREIADAMPGGSGTSLATAANQATMIASLDVMDDTIRAEGSTLAAKIQVTGGKDPSGAYRAFATTTEGMMRLPTFAFHTTDNVANGSWNTAKALTLPSDNVRLFALGVSLGTIAALTDLDWYLSWDNTGLIPVTDRVSWSLASDMGLARNGTDYIAVGKIDLAVERPSGVGTANTVYLHTYGTAGTAAGTWTLYGTE